MIWFDKEIPESENPKKVVDIVEKILNFDKQQKGKGVKILTQFLKNYQ